MIVEFWNVGATTASSLPLTVQNVSSHILADWLPALPISLSPTLIGWPPFLIQLARTPLGNCLALQKKAARTEKQWKGFVSWMLGVAGTRQFLESEGYRWIAPLSAFYPETNQEYDLSGWNVRFPPTSLKAERLQGSPSRLRPDYLAIRPLPSSEVPGGFELAVAESKGTHTNLMNRNSCPVAWYNQARNVSISIDNSPIQVSRHMVVATRVNPNGVRLKTRRLQVRAWNKADEQTTPLPPEVAPNIIAAHLFGFFLNLGLYETARAISLSVITRDQVRRDLFDIETSRGRDDSIAASEDELQSRTMPSSPAIPGFTSRVLVGTTLGQVEVAIATPTIDLTRHLREARSFDECYPVIREADSQLDRWNAQRVDRADKVRTVVLPFGAELTFPENWNRI
jgi:hypothetical protein